MQTWQDKTPLHQALCYALQGAGKRVRPLIVLLLADALGHGADVCKGALALEFFHTASLIADDLPCMDNAQYRRKQKSVHRAFDEETALLASYALISEAFSCLYQNASQMSASTAFLQRRASKALFCALDCTSRCAGIQGATLGQYYDIKRDNKSRAEFKELIEKKTITLFEGAFVVGWAFGGGDLEELPKVQNAAYHFGMCFQLLDDLADREQDAKKAPNIANTLGEDITHTLIQQALEKQEQAMRALRLNQATQQALLSLLQQEPQLLASS